MTETPIFFWTDRAERGYAFLRKDGGHWRVEWGYRDPPGSDNYLQQGEHQNSVEEDVIQTMLAQVRRLCSDPADFEGVEERLRQALAETEIPE
jgi:hypothetical protein